MRLYFHLHFYRVCSSQLCLLLRPDASVFRLKLEKISHVYVCGLATDFCCKFTAIDSKSCGFVTSFLLPLCRGVGSPPEPFNPAETVKELAGHGVHVVHDLTTITKL